MLDYIIEYTFKKSHKELQNLSNESREKLINVKPETLGQASRIAGVRPSDIGILALYIKSN